MFLQLLERYNRLKILISNHDSKKQESVASQEIKVNVLRSLYEQIKKRFRSFKLKKTSNDLISDLKINNETILDEDFKKFIENLDHYYENKDKFSMKMNSTEEEVNNELEQTKDQVKYNESIRVLKEKHDAKMKSLPRDGFDLFAEA